MEILSDKVIEFIFSIAVSSYEYFELLYLNIKQKSINMKTFSKRRFYICLFNKNFPTYTAYTTETNPYCLENYIRFILVFSLTSLPFFSVEVPNKTFSSFNPFKCLFRALESQSIGMAKYTHLKERTRNLDLWNSL